MNKNIFKTIAVISAAAVLIAGFSSCGTKKDDADAEQLTYWMDLDPSAAMTVSQYGETQFAKELQKKVGVTIKFEHPAQGQATERFNIMVASNNLPDIVEYSWTGYPGGPGKAIKDGYVLKLNDLLSKNAPHYSKYLKDNQIVDKMVKTDSGDYFGFPFVRGDKSLQVSAGLVVRKDWLDNLGLSVPETIADWETMLTEFKDKKNATAPLSIARNTFNWGAFTGAFQTTRGFYVRDGKVIYGPSEENYKKFLTLMNNWYGKKLLDNNIATVDTKIIDTNILNGFSGATAGSVGSGIGKWMAAKTSPEFDLIAAPYPVMNKGERPQFGQIQLKVPYTYAAVTTSCKNVETAMKLLDYGYSQEGSMLYNFGIEGESYTMVNGEPVYTEQITNNPEKLSMSAAMAKYLRAYNAGPFVQDKRYMDQYAALPSQKEAWKIWSDTDADKTLLPQIYLKEEEIKEIASLKNAVDTYEDEYVTKFIMGIEPIANFNKYVDELNARGLEKILSAYQSAYERALSR